MSRPMLKTARETYNGWDAWNERQRAAGHEFAQIPVPPRWKRAKIALRLTVEEARSRIALRIAPWLDPPSSS